MSEGKKDDLKLNRPFAGLEQEAVVNIIRTSEELMGSIAQVIKPHGLSVPGFNVLRILRGAGKGGRTCGEIAERLVTRVPDCTRLLDRLQQGGLVERERDQNDRRVVRSRLTDAGKKMLSRIDKPLLENTLNTMGKLSQARLRGLIEALEDIRKTL
jgi:DNA-binding MarR family transcriptional regulator